MSEGARHPFDGLSAKEFERSCVYLLRKLGHRNVVWRKGTSGESSGADGGYDIEAVLSRTDPDEHTWQERWFVECKQRRRETLRYRDFRALLDLDEEADVLLAMVDGELTLQTRRRLDEWRSRHPRTRLRVWERHDLEDLWNRVLGPAPDEAGSVLRDFLAASDRTGHSEPGTRRSAFAVLEQLGTADPNLRQDVVDQICHYLRSPTRQEPEEPRLRQYLQDILRRRLTAWDENGDPTDDAWEEISLDLTGAELTDFTLWDGSVYRADFTGARFLGSTDFRKTNFQHHASFVEASFAGKVYFTGCRISEAGADFSGAVFQGTCIFHRASFEGMVDFAHAYFAGEASFLRVHFVEAADFQYVAFRDGVTFERACFDDTADFTGVNFGPMGHFCEAYFKDAVSFHGAVPVDNIDLHHVLADSSLARQTWPEGWTSAFPHCLAVVSEDEKADVISRDGAGLLCQRCRVTGVCRLQPVEQG
ncbi:hypothetical protein GCM10022254_63050 [Actinomadura meridiana]|uniref:Pentapeptide repeat-containing protein n=1 Tax=Actinomadura meridiana TaxID=559626 RepID=A0ABP8CJ77_9ACTN